MRTVLADNVWVDGTLLSKGTASRAVPFDLVGRIGGHLWVPADAAPTVSYDGEALAGLSDNVWVDGVLYAKGTVPPPAAAAKVGDHLWVDGVRPSVVSGQAAPAPADDDLDDTEGDDEAPEDDVTDGDGSDDEGGDSEPDNDDESAAPPLEEPRRAGPGATRAAWVLYAESLGMTAADDQTRDDIIDMVDARRAGDDATP